MQHRIESGRSILAGNPRPSAKTATQWRSALVAVAGAWTAFD